MKRILTIFALACLAALAGPAMAAIAVIPAGGTAFIGEQGLDITAGLGGNNAIAWFPSTATSTSATPEKIIDVTATKTDFYVNPTDFPARTGNWYSWAPGLTAGTATVAFRVESPYLSLKVIDMDAENIDVSDGWLYKGDEAGFQIDTNLYAMAERAGVAGAPVTIRFQTPEGGIMTAVTNRAGTANPLTDLPVGTSPYSTGRFWDSDNAQYSAGTYTLWAECTANSINNNYGQAGNAVSQKITVLVQERNPLITAGSGTTATTGTTAAATTTATVTKTATTAVTTTGPSTTGTAATTEGTVVSTTAVTDTAGTTAGQDATTPTYAGGFGPLIAVLGIAGCALYLNRRR